MGIRRNTIQRSLVLQTVRSMHNHPTAEQVHAELAQKHPAISRGTVYRNLGILAESGDIQRVSHLNAADRFDFNCASHYHFRCRNCGGVFDIGLPYREGLPRELGEEYSFLIETCDIVFTGLCPDCQKHSEEKNKAK